MWRGLPLRLTRTAAVLSTALVLTTCTSDTPFAPRAPITAQFDVSGLFKAAGQFNISIDRVVVEFRKFSDSSLVMADTIPASQITQSGDSLRILVKDIPLESSSEHFYLHVFAYSGGVLYYQVSTDLTVNAGSTPTTTPPLAPTYSGPGFDADSLAFRLDTAIFAGDSVLLTASAYKAGVLVAPAAPVAYDITPLADTLKVPRPRAISTYQAWAKPKAGLTDSVTITAKLPNNLSKTGTLRFSPRVSGPVASLALAPDTQIVTLAGDSARFTPTCRDNTNAIIACGTVTYNSLQPGIATITSTGYAYAGTTAGAAQIVATAGTVADTAIFIYNGIANIQITPADTVLSSVGDSVFLKAASVRFLGGPPTQLPNSQVTWQTLTPVVAQVNANGRVLAIGAGVATIQATSAGVSGITTVQVRQKPVSFSVTPKVDSIGVGGSVTLLGKTFDKNGVLVPGRTVAWTSRNTNVATVSVGGQVTGVSLGSTYVVGTDSSFADSAQVLVVTNPPQNIQWGADSTSVGRGTTFQQAILLSTPPSGNVTVNIALTVPADTMILKPVQSQVTFGTGQTSQTVSFQGRAAGRVLVTATDPTGLYKPDTLIVAVLSTLDFRTIQNPASQATSFSINSAEQRTIYVFLSDPAPAAGLAVTFQATTPGIATIAPATATIPGGQLSAQVDLTGTGVGSTQLTPMAAGYVGKLSSITTFLAQFTVYNVPTYVGAGQNFQAYVQIPNSMDRSLLVNIARTNPTAGSTPDTVRIPTASNYVYFPYQALVPGKDTISASKTGWVTGKANVQVTTPRVYPTYSGSTTAGGPLASWYVYVYDSLRSSSYPRNDTLRVTVHSSDPTVFTVVDSTAVIVAGSNTVTRSNSLQPVAGGQAYLIATAPGHIRDSSLVNIQPAKLSGQLGYPYIIGARQQLLNTYFQLPFQRSVPVVVHLSHLRPAFDSLLADSLIFPVNSTTQYFNINGLTPGTDTIIATATGYVADTLQLQVVQPHVWESGLSSSYYITSPAVPFSVCVAPYARTCGYNVPSLDTVAVTLSVSNPSKATLDSTVVHVLKGGYISPTQARFTPLDTGTVVIRFSAPAPYANDSLIVTINAAPLTLSGGSPGYVGLGQYQTGTVSIPNVPGDTVRAAIGHTRTPRGTVVPDTVKIPPVTTAANFRWTGTVIGVDSIQATATGFLTSGIAQLNVARPQIVHYAPGFPSTAVVNDTISFFTAYASDSILKSYFYSHPVQDTVFVTVTSTDPNVLRIDSTAVYRILPNQSTVSIPRMITVGPGIARVIMTATTTGGAAPITYIPDTTAAVVVTAPAITLNPASFTMGKGQQYRSYYAQIPNGVATPTNVALVLSDTTVAGLSTDTVTIVAGATTSPAFTVFGKNKVASIQLTGSATGFTQGSAVVVVNNPLLSVNPTTTGYVGQGSIAFYTYATDETGSTREVSAPLALTLSSTNTAVLTIDSSTVIPANASLAYSSFKPVGAGVAYIVATAPGYKPDTSAAITISTPRPVLNLTATLGVAQRYTNSYVSIPFNWPGPNPLTVTLNTQGTALTVPATVSIPANTNYAYFNEVGATVGTGVLTASATGFTTSLPDTTVVGQPHLFLSGSTSGSVGGQSSYYAYTQDQANQYQQPDADLPVTFTVDNATVADFGGQNSVQATATAGGSYAGPVTLNLKAPGTVTITATAGGYTQGVITITVQ